MFRALANRNAREGFTLVELAVVIVVIGVLAAFGVPRFMKSVERSKAAEAFAYLGVVRAAQERYQAREGVYATDMGLLDIQAPPPKYFSVGPMKATETAWTLTLTRTGSAPGYGTYTVIFTQDGFDSNSTIGGFPEINPMGTDPGAGPLGN